MITCLVAIPYLKVVIIARHDQVQENIIISNILCNKLIQVAARQVTNENAFDYYLKITAETFSYRAYMQ